MNLKSLLDQLNEYVADCEKAGIEDLSTIPIHFFDYFTDLPVEIIDMELRSKNKLKAIFITMTNKEQDDD